MALLHSAERTRPHRSARGPDPSRRAQVDLANVRAEAGHLIREHRKSLTLGLGLMVVNRLAGLVLPALPKYLIDDVIGGGRPELLLPLVLVAATASLIQAGTSFGLSQVVSVAARGRSPRCGGRCRRTCSGCPWATSTPPRPAS